jgi:hypothetical protein
VSDPVDILNKIAGSSQLRSAVERAELEPYLQTPLLQLMSSSLDWAITQPSAVQASLRRFAANDAAISLACSVLTDDVGPSDSAAIALQVLASIAEISEEVC